MARFAFNTFVAAPLAKAELQHLADKYDGNRQFVRKLSSVQDGAHVLTVLGRYIQFNAVFAGGVANLAGEIAVRFDLFRDPTEPCAGLADHSSEIGAAVFAAAVDEFVSRSKVFRGTHRAMAKALFHAAADFYADPKAAAAAIQIDRMAKATREMVLDGYAVNRALGEKKLFNALGFHLGSEMLADKEFRILDRFLRGRHPRLVAHLRQTPLPNSPKTGNAYSWIAIHTTVEAEHFDAGLQGINDALRFYAGKENRAAVRQWTLEGFSQFARMQSGFMERLTR